jgi:hypothetical protein
VALTSDPPGAIIFVDGSKMGNTPVTASLPIGPIQVTSRFGSLVPVAQTLTLDPERMVSFHFKHSYGTLTVNSDRTDAALIVDGTDYGHPPAQLFLSPGSHKILLTAPNAPDKTRRVDLSEGERVGVRILFGGATTEIVSIEMLDAPPAPANSAPRPPAIAVVAPAATRSERELSPIPQAPPTPAPTVSAGVELGSPNSADALRPVIPEASLEVPPTPALPENRLKSSRSPAVSLLALKKNSLVPSNASPTPALKPEQARSKEEAYWLFNMEWKRMESELEAEKKNIELQIKSSTGTLREQWKYRLVQWRLKKAQAERDGAAAKAKLKEQWK